jgi:hypothetical protein
LIYKGFIGRNKYCEKYGRATLIQRDNKWHMTIAYKIRVILPRNNSTCPSLVPLVLLGAGAAEDVPDGVNELDAFISLNSDITCEFH